jgi:hypothetical protein
MHLRGALIRAGFAYHRLLALSMAYVACREARNFCGGSRICLGQKGKAGPPVVNFRLAGMPGRALWRRLHHGPVGPLAA